MRFKHELCAAAAFVFSVIVSQPAFSSSSTLFPPENASECNANTALTWSGSGNVRCDPVVKSLPNMDPVSARSVTMQSLTAYNSIITNAINMLIPLPRTANDTAVANGFRSTCIITDPTGGDGSVANALTSNNSGTCRNLICSYTDPQHRWNLLNTTRGFCLQGQAWVSCPTGQFNASVGCLYTSGASDISYP